jgi:hypothetical protein
MNTTERAFINLAGVQLRQDQRGRAQYALQKAQHIVDSLLGLVGAVRTESRGPVLRPSYRP